MGTQATAFGLDIDSDLALLFLRGACAKPTGRALSVSVDARARSQPDWPEGGKLICDERTSTGDVNFRIETHPRAGFLISGPEYGAHLLSGDGGHLRCFPEGLPDGSWQRLLVAQVLPFAALLHGLEVFHASAVLQDGETIAFVGPSRSGKTSLAIELCNRGARFVADDVLALESRAGRLMANPGSPIAGVDRGHSLPCAHDGDGSVENSVVATNDRELIVRIAGAVEPTPLGRLFFIDRRANGPEIPHFRAADDARMLLAATFNFVLATPERLEGLLDVCALAARLQVEMITTGTSTRVVDLADAVTRRLRPSP